MHLSESQSIIVNAPIDQPLQVLASAGSGKTRVLTERVRHILESTKKDGVIALTFTNKAAQEMQDRLVECEAAAQRSWIATIHSVAQRILEQYGHKIGLPDELHIYDRDKDRMAVFMQSLREEGIDIDDYLNVSSSKEKRDRERQLQNLLEGFSLIKRELLTETAVTQRFPHDPPMWKMYQDYQNALLNSGGIDYEDILVYAHRILLNQPSVAKIYRAKYKHICVDEAQDLNRVQYEFIKTFCGDSITSILMVGDPNQMIYGFNGSSADYFNTEFKNDFNPVCYQLNENFRSTQAVIGAANKLKPASQKSGNYTLAGRCKIRAFEDEATEAQWITKAVKYLLNEQQHPEIEGQITLDKMVVIARNRFVFTRLELALEEQGIAYSLRKGERQTEPLSLFGKILDYAIRLKLNPKDWVDGDKLCELLGQTPPTDWGKGNPDLLGIWAQQVQNSSLPFPELYSHLLVAVNELELSAPRIPRFIKQLNEKISVIVKQYDDSEELRLAAEELNEFNSNWTKFNRKGLGDTLAAFANAMALGQLAEEINHGGLTLSTVHTMKGLEKDIVFLMGMCEGVFPDYRAHNTKEIDEERNSAFVAVTRAKRWLYITWPKQRIMPWGDSKHQQQSQFIGEIER